MFVSVFIRTDVIICVSVKDEMISNLDASSESIASRRESNDVQSYWKYYYLNICLASLNKCKI
jgi:hypothetical protein